MTGDQRPYHSPYFDFEQCLADPKLGDGFRAWAAMAIASRGHTQPEIQVLPEGDGPLVDRLPRWPSTIHQVEQRCGGFYGMTVILGSRGLGKTLLALGSCIEAAASHEFQVVYLSAELDHHEIALRIGRTFDRHPGTQDCVGFFHVVHLGRGFDISDLCSIVEERTDPAGPPILVCLDSVNTAAELSGGEYLSTLRRISLWSMLARRMSNGIASFLLVSETNKLGGAKGGSLDYWADVVLRLSRPKGPGVELSLDKSRRTLGEGSLGLYARGLTRFEPQERRLRAVGQSRDFALDPD